MIIGISGKIGAGKDNVKDILIRYFESNGRTVECRAFAKKLKETVAILTDTTYDEQCSHVGKIN